MSPTGFDRTIPAEAGLSREKRKMGEENEREDEDHDDEEEDEEEDEDEIVRMPQKNFTKVMERERTKGKRIARREVFKEFGVKDADELRSRLAASQNRDDEDEEDSKEKNRESEAARRATEKAQRERDEARAEAAQVRLESKVERALLAADVPAKQVARVARMISLETDADDDEINDAVEDLKQDMPHLFGTTTDEGDDGEGDDNDSSDRNDRTRRSGPPRSDPGQPRRKRRPSGSTKDQAKSLLHERHPNLVKN